MSNKNVSMDYVITFLLRKAKGHFWGRGLFPWGHTKKQRERRLHRHASIRGFIKAIRILEEARDFGPGKGATRCQTQSKWKTT